MNGTMNPPRQQSTCKPTPRCVASSANCHVDAMSEHDTWPSFGRHMQQSCSGNHAVIKAPAISGHHMAVICSNHEVIKAPAISGRLFRVRTAAPSQRGRRCLNRSALPRGQCKFVYLVFSVFESISSATWTGRVSSFALTRVRGAKNRPTFLIRQLRAPATWSTSMHWVAGHARAWRSCIPKYCDA